MSEIKPAAWLHSDRPEADVVTDKVKNVWGGAVVGSLAAYSIPLYLSPPEHGIDDARDNQHYRGIISELNQQAINYCDRIALLEKVCEAAVIVANGTYSLRDDVCDLKDALRAAGYLEEPAP